MQITPIPQLAVSASYHLIFALSLGSKKPDICVFTAAKCSVGYTIDSMTLASSCTHPFPGFDTGPDPLELHFNTLRMHIFVRHSCNQVISLIRY